MDVKDVAIRQYRAIVDRAAASMGTPLDTPREGWIATVRKALGMSAAQLGRRLGVTRARISRAEQAELAGGVTLRTMESVAKAMGCRFVYSIVPVDGPVGSVIEAQARRKAEALVGKASVQMGLERQSLPEEKNRAEVDRLAGELMRAMGSDFWTET